VDLVWPCSAPALGSLLPAAGPALLAALEQGICDLQGAEEEAVLAALQAGLHWDGLGAAAANLSTSSSQTAASLAGWFGGGLDNLARLATDRRKRETEGRVQGLLASWDAATLRKAIQAAVHFLEQLHQHPERVIKDLLSQLNATMTTCDSESADSGLICSAGQPGLAEMMKAAYTAIVAKIPIWKRLSELPLVAGNVTGINSCHVNVNLITKYLANNTDAKSVVRCGGRIEKREIPTNISIGDILASLNVSEILANLSSWRQEEFSSLDWMENYKNVTDKIMKELDNIADQVETLVSPSLVSSLNADEILRAVVASPEFRKVLQSLQTIMDEVEVFVADTELEADFVQFKESLTAVTTLPVFTSATVTVSSAFKDWESVAAVLAANTPLTEAELGSLAGQGLSPSLLLLLHMKAGRLHSHLCDGLTPMLGRYLSFSSPAPLNITGAVCTFLQGPGWHRLFQELNIPAALVSSVPAS
jgi:hypothetical protein